MKGINKQATGFRFGQHPLKVLDEFGEAKYHGRSYKIVRVQTAAAEHYISIRLYNDTGKFIKQFLMEPPVAQSIGYILNLAPWKGG